MKRFGSFFALVLLSLCLLGVSSAAVVPLAGSLDPSFGTGGVVIYSSGGPSVTPGGGIVVQPDGKIVVVAFGSVVRYLPDGSLDSGFGAGGYVATGFEVDAVALQPDGKIVVAGSDSTGSEFAVARYNPDGSPDASFGTDGITTTIIPGPGGCNGGCPGTYANALAILPGGDIVAAGSASGPSVEPFGPDSWFALARYKPDGSLDPTFGDAGIVHTVFVGPDVLGGIVVQPDGKIVATGTGGTGEDDHYVPGVEAIVLARYEPNGSLDPTFGDGGKVTTPLGEPNTRHLYIGGPAVLQHGRIFVAGAFHRDDSLLVARYKPDGSLDHTFGKYGLAKISGATGPASAVAAQQDGKILIATPYKVVRLLPNGLPDAHFGKEGFVSLPFQLAEPPTIQEALALQTDGKILVGGTAGNSWTTTRLIGGNNCVVPTLRGKTISQATITLKKAYCGRGHISTRFASKVTRGRVISTAPPRGARLPGGAKVDLFVSKGK